MFSRIIGVNHHVESSHFELAKQEIGRLPQNSAVAIEVGPSFVESIARLRKWPDGVEKACRGKTKAYAFFAKLTAHAQSLGHAVIGLEDELAQVENVIAIKTFDDTLYWTKAADRSKIFFEKIKSEKPSLSIIGALHGRDIQEAGHPVELPAERNWRVRIKSAAINLLWDVRKHLFANTSQINAHRSKVIREMAALYLRS